MKVTKYSRVFSASNKTAGWIAQLQRDIRQPSLAEKLKRLDQEENVHLALRVTHCIYKDAFSGWERQAKKIDDDECILVEDIDHIRRLGPMEVSSIQGNVLISANRLTQGIVGV